MPNQNRRLFIGLQPPPQAAERLVARSRGLLGDLPGTLVYRPEDLHLTLAYLGPFPSQAVDALGEALKAEIRGMNAPELTMSGSGAHPSMDEPRSLWAGVLEEGEVQGRLPALRNRALQAALSLGWRQQAPDRKRPFRPHITLAKPPPDSGIQAFLDHDWTGAWLPVEVTLFESLGLDQGDRYRPLASFPLVVRPG